MICCGLTSVKDQVGHGRYFNVPIGYIFFSSPYHKVHEKHEDYMLGVCMRS